MPRNGSGTATLAEPPFVPATPISSAAMNSDLSDIISMLTGSLARDGQGGMTAVLPLANAGFTYVADPNTGMKRTGADEQAIVCGGTNIVTVASSGLVNVEGVLDADLVRQSGVRLMPIGLGPLPWSGRTAPALWVLANGQTLLRASYPDLWAFAQAEIAGGNQLYGAGNGTTTFTVPDLRGGAPFGENGGTSRITNANSGINGDILGAGGGGPNHTLLTANLPPYTPAGSVTNGAITTTIDGGLQGATGTSTTVSAAGVQLLTGATSITATSSQAASSFAGTAQGGTSTALITQPRTIITNFIIFAGN